MVVSLSNLELMSLMIEKANEGPHAFGEYADKVARLMREFFRSIEQETQRRPLECPVCIQVRAAATAFIDLYVRENGSPDGCPFRLDPMDFCEETYRMEVG